MHVVNPHWVSGTRRRCQAIAVLISLQLCLISSVEANHLTVGELGSPDTGTVEPTWRRQWWTSHLLHFFFLYSSEERLLSNACSILSNARLNTLPAGSFPTSHFLCASLILWWSVILVFPLSFLELLISYISQSSRTINIPERVAAAVGYDVLCEGGGKLHSSRLSGGGEGVQQRFIKVALQSNCSRQYET